MRRILSALLIILLLSLPAMAEQSFSPYDYVTGSVGGGRYLYFDFPDISLYLPASWEGRFVVEQDDYGVAFYQTASYDKYLEDGLEGGGFLFRLGASEDESFRDLLAYEYLGYSENAGLHFLVKVGATLSEDAILDRCRSMGLQIRSLGSYYHGTVPPEAERMLEVNYSGLTHRDLERLERLLRT